MTVQCVSQSVQKRKTATGKQRILGWACPKVTGNFPSDLSHFPSLAIRLSLESFHNIELCQRVVRSITHVPLGDTSEINNGNSMQTECRSKLINGPRMEEISLLMPSAFIPHGSVLESFLLPS